jgi:hypothetical protein
MKPRYISRTSAVSLILALPAGAEVIYSNLKDIAIPATFAGVYLDVDTGNWNTNINAPQSGWDINPFFSRSVLWNSPGFQPVGNGTGEMDALLNSRKTPPSAVAAYFRPLSSPADNRFWSLQDVVCCSVHGFGPSGRFSTIYKVRGLARVRRR